jgi:hypothetical protein
VAAHPRIDDVVDAKVRRRAEQKRWRARSLRKREEWRRRAGQRGGSTEGRHVPA